MPSSLAERVSGRHLLSSESRPRMAKADLRKAETNAEWLELGRILARVQVLSGLSLKEFADAVQRDERQIARMKDGKERPQIEAVYAVARFRQMLIQALGESAGAEVEVTVKLRRVG